MANVRAAGDSHPPLHLEGRNPPAPSRSLKLLRIHLVRQYDLPSYGMEELEVDYAFVIFMKCYEERRNDRVEISSIWIRSCDGQVTCNIHLFTELGVQLFSSLSTPVLTLLLARSRSLM